MKSFLLIAFFLLTSFIGHCQASNIDSLIAKLDNQKLYGICNYVWVLKNNCKEADTLISIGKSRGIKDREFYGKLYRILTDTKKGVVAHYILTHIFQEDNSGIGSVYFEDESVREYNCNGLRFYQDDHGKIFADTDELKHNQKVWKVLFKELSLIE